MWDELGYTGEAVLRGRKYTVTIIKQMNLLDPDRGRQKRFPSS